MKANKINKDIGHHKKLIELFGSLSWDIQNIKTKDISESHHRELIRELIYKRVKELYNI